MTESELGQLLFDIQSHKTAHLDLSNKEITYNEIEQIAAKLLKNSHITSLNIRGNTIGDAGAIALAKNKTLTSLDVSENQIGDVGAIALAENNTLHKLIAHHNLIGATGKKALKENSRLYLKITETEYGGLTVAGFRVPRSQPQQNPVTTYSMWNTKTAIAGVILAADPIVNLIAYFLGGALATFLSSPPGIVISVVIALAALSYLAYASPLVQNQALSA